MLKLDLQKAEEPEIDQIANICWIIERAREFQKKHLCLFIDYLKAFECVDHNKLWKILKEMGYQATWHDSWETYMQVRKQHLELYMEHILVPNRKRSMPGLYIVTLLV